MSDLAALCFSRSQLLSRDESSAVQLGHLTRQAVPRASQLCRLNGFAPGLVTICDVRKQKKVSADDTGDTRNELEQDLLRSGNMPQEND